MRHQVCTIALHLLIRGYSAEDNLSKLSRIERTIRDSSVLYQYPNPTSLGNARRL